MGRNSMRLSSSIGGKEHFSRVTRLHGRLHPLFLEYEDFERAFMDAATLLKNASFSVCVGPPEMKHPLPTIQLVAKVDDGIWYKLTGSHSFGHYTCWRSDGKHYKLTELRSNVIARKVRAYFGD